MLTILIGRRSSIVNGYLTASALIKLASPSDITAGMGRGVTEGAISQDLSGYSG